jgi:hypothetical protein
MRLRWGCGGATWSLIAQATTFSGVKAPDGANITSGLLGFNGCTNVPFRSRNTPNATVTLFPNVWRSSSAELGRSRATVCSGCEPSALDFGCRII